MASANRPPWLGVSDAYCRGFFISAQHPQGSPPASHVRCHVAFAMAYSLHRPARYAAGGGGGGFGGLGGGGFGGFGGSIEATPSRLWPAWRGRPPILRRPVACGTG